jgi:K+-transporting ATPase KdpF subunit
MLFTEHGKEQKSRAGPFLSRCRLPGAVAVLGFCKSLRQAVIPGLISAGLFAYLLYALLKPERF